ncbi:sugar-binding protein [Thalassotalea euphylliae]|uniref:sugar-binding protein n=1 Tax=Thalassotalea euphylliae TaxID=1655234 RepID=UPI003630C8E6
MVLRKIGMAFCAVAALSSQAKDVNGEVIFTDTAISVDGKIDTAWENDNWRGMNHHILGDLPEATDFSGDYKLLWDEQYLYLLARIYDDVLFDSHPNPLENYWDDDCLEIFIDADASGGEHQHDFNAFAYHVALDNQVVDLAPIGDNYSKPALFNSHVTSAWQRSDEPGNPIYWETAIKLYDESYALDGSRDKKSRVRLGADQKIGFMLAYCDNDGSNQREHFMGSTAIKPINNDKNLGYKTADVFDVLTLVKK